MDGLVAKQVKVPLKQAVQYPRKGPRAHLLKCDWDDVLLAIGLSLEQPCYVLIKQFNVNFEYVW